MHPYRHAIALGSFGLLLFTPALFGQTSSPEQREVLAVVEKSWEADLAEDTTWVDRLTYPNLPSWGQAYPMPRGRDQTKRWNQYEDENSRALLHQLARVGIAMHGDAAVVHYYVSVASEGREDSVKRLTLGVRTYWSGMVQRGSTSLGIAQMNLATMRGDATSGSSLTARYQL